MDRRRLLLIAVCAFATAYTLQFASRQLRRSAALDAKITAPAASVSAASRALRPNYPYSVIPGGAYSSAELQSAIQRDHLVSDHYTDFDLKSAHLVRLTDDRFQYVSYRLQNRVYWTRNKLRIPKGEILLTDGYNFARTRCGNRLSSKPRPETAPQQPSERTLSLPPFTPALLTKGDVTLAPPPVVELAQGAPALPFDLPRLAPYLPGEALTGLPGGPVGQVFQSYPPMAGVISAGPPPIGLGYLPVTAASPAGPVQGPNSPSVATPLIPGVLPLPGVQPLPIAPIIPGTPVPPIINEVPEPASLSLFAASLCGLLWLLTRVMRTDQRKRA